MGFFSRFVAAVADVVESAVDAVTSVFTTTAESVAEVTEDAVESVDDAIADDAREPDDYGDDDAARADLAERMGPLDESEDAEATTREIELEQWIAFFDAHPNQVPPGFTSELRDLFDDGMDFDDDLYSTTEYDSPVETE